MNEENPDLQYKLLFLGDISVGKTSLLIRYMDNKYEAGIPTVGIDVRYKFITYNNKTIRLDIWDTAGQERFNSLTNTYIKGANGIIFVYDKTNKNSFERLKRIMMDTKEKISNEVVIMVVENKNDLEVKEVSEKAVNDFEIKNNVKVYSTSAKTGDGVEQLFKDLIQKILNNKNNDKVKNDNNYIAARKNSHKLNKNINKQKNDYNKCKC